jgi:hypothetical protein
MGKASEPSKKETLFQKLEKHWIEKYFHFFKSTIQVAEWPSCCIKSRRSCYLRHCQINAELGFHCALTEILFP